MSYSYRFSFCVRQKLWGGQILNFGKGIPTRKLANGTSVSERCSQKIDFSSSPFSFWSLDDVLKLNDTGWLSSEISDWKSAIWSKPSVEAPWHRLVPDRWNNSLRGCSLENKECLSSTRTLLWQEAGSLEWIFFYFLRLHQKKALINLKP